MNALFDIYVQQFKTTLAAQVAATLLPFRWTIGFPAELLLGRLTPSKALTGFAAQAVWLALSLALLKIIWRAGVRRYSAVGS